MILRFPNLTDMGGVCVSSKTQLFEFKTAYQHVEGVARDRRMRMAKLWGRQGNAQESYPGIFDENVSS